MVPVLLSYCWVTNDSTPRSFKATSVCYSRFLGTRNPGTACLSPLAQGLSRGGNVSAGGYSHFQVQLEVRSQDAIFHKVLGSWSPHWLLPGDVSQFLALGPLHRAPHNVAPSFPQSQLESPG